MFVPDAMLKDRGAWALVGYFRAAGRRPKKPQNQGCGVQPRRKRDGLTLHYPPWLGSYPGLGFPFCTRLTRLHVPGARDRALRPRTRRAGVAFSSDVGCVYLVQHTGRVTPIWIAMRSSWRPARHDRRAGQRSSGSRRGISPRT